MRVRANVVQGRGAPQTVELEARTVEEARQQALQLGYAVLSLEVAGGAWKDLFSRSIGRQSSVDLSVFVEQLRDLLLAGLSLIEGLEALRRGATGESAQMLEAIRQDLQGGRRFSDALSRQPRFPPLLVALVRASELTSDLPETLSSFLDHERRVTEVRHRIVSTSIYPLLLIGVGSLVLLFLFFYVMPRFARIFEGMTGDLPWSARLMVAWAHLLAQYGNIVLAVLGVALVGLVALTASGPFRARAAAAIISWSPLGDRLNTYFLARWYRATGMLVSGGIPLPEALGLSHALLPSALKAGGLRVEQGVREGLTPSRAHVLAGMATPIAEQLMLAGERIGDLGSVLTRIAQFHESDVSRALERTMRALEPIVMVAIGLGVGVVVVLMYLPIFELASAIQ